MRQSIVIPGRLPGLNEHVRADRTNPYKGAKLKDEATEMCWLYFLNYLNLGLLKPVTYKVDIDIWWYDDSKRDPDNIYHGIKYILDGAVKAGFLINDDRKHIGGISHHLETDKNDPRIEITFSEVMK